MLKFTIILFCSKSIWDFIAIVSPQSFAFLSSLFKIISKVEYGNFLKNYVPNNFPILLAEKIEKFLFTLLFEIFDFVLNLSPPCFLNDKRFIDNIHESQNALLT